MSIILAIQQQQPTSPVYYMHLKLSKHNGMLISHWAKILAKVF